MTKHINKIIILIVSVFILSCGDIVTNPSSNIITISQRKGTYEGIAIRETFRIRIMFKLDDQANIIYLEKSSGKPVITEDKKINISKDIYSTATEFSFVLESTTYTIQFNSDSEISGGKLLENNSSTGEMNDYDLTKIE
ncbi:hypothetical protein [uncultured Brachyspira sp.]|uniref:hypothetical protein n=1 Tax=uncultured Brachyspira sp. TaxID=221953 RepID=UPI00261C7E90|nr:hypothetical protein [uncultured Brachyspira sp.]